MNNVLILSCAALLFVPGPTNILLLNSGARQGFRKAHLLMIAEWGGYLFSITSWSAEPPRESWRLNSLRER